jgi:hypothetical protein
LPADSIAVMAIAARRLRSVILVACGTPRRLSTPRGLRAGSGDNRH